MLYLRRSSKSYQYAALTLRGVSSRDAAAQLGVAVPTVEMYRRRLRAKAQVQLGYRPSYELCALAVVCPAAWELLEKQIAATARISNPTEPPSCPR